MRRVLPEAPALVQLEELAESVTSLAKQIKAAVADLRQQDTQLRGTGHDQAE